jgi:predicted phage terminase large subunit-like protein
MPPAIVDVMERQRRVNASGFQALCQGQPSAREGQLFRRDSAGTYQADPQRIVSTMEWVCISVDATFGASSRADFVSMAVIGGRGPLRFLLDERTERLTYPQTKMALKEMARRWPTASVLIERKANGQALIDDLRGELGRVLPFDPQGSKETRASFAAEVFEAGQFLVPQAHYLPTLADFLEDIYGFGSRPNDDRVDAVSQALIHYAGRQDAVANLRRITEGYVDWSQAASWIPGGR